MRIRIAPAARADLLGIKEYITRELENPSAAANTVEKIKKAVRRIADFPESGAPLAMVLNLSTDYRFVVGGNYLVFYRCDKDVVYVVRIIYGKRDFAKILFGKTDADAD